MPTKKSGRVRFVAASDQTLLVSFEGQSRKSAAKHAARTKVISGDAHERVRRLTRLLEQEPIPGIKNLHPAYESVLVKFDALKLRHEDLADTLQKYLKRMTHVALPEPRTVEIPVCYGDEFGPDLQDVAQLHGLTPPQVIELHASTIYNVYFLGFVPGFAYLGELPRELETPRLPTPRRSVPAGSVGIAAKQTGVYPISTPGGWRLLGRTPSRIFQPERAAMSLLEIGDRVKFVPISRAEFDGLERA
jgi:inhibitor of KinA